MMALPKPTFDRLVKYLVGQPYGQVRDLIEEIEKTAVPVKPVEKQEVKNDQQ